MEIRFAFHDRGAETDLGAMTLASLDAGRRLLDRLRDEAAVRPGPAASRGSATLHGPDGVVIETIDLPGDAAMAFVLALTQLGRMRPA